MNLYHILCGMVFDGNFFDYLSDNESLAPSRQHPSGLDYLSVIYEKCDELQTLSNGLLCSYNRWVNDKCSLQSFGDANGSRFDFYRFFRLMERESIPAKFKDTEAILHKNYGGANKDVLLLEQFSYMQNGNICAPIYTPEHRKYIMEIEVIIEKCLGTVMSRTLNDLATSIDITAINHGVNRLEIANELYHILFGSINEELVLWEIVADPMPIPGEGRYFRCIEVYE